MLTTEEIAYQDDDTTCLGFMAYDNEWKTPRPVVMVAHDWRGRGEVACAKAEQLVALGYIGFAIDMYGDGKLGFDNLQRRALMTPLLQDRKKLANRIQQAFNLLTRHPLINAEKMAAIGYCFGGLCVLDLARSGVDIKGVVSFHGLLTAPEGVPYQPLKSKILILHGHDDPLVPREQLDQFALEMNERQADWQIHDYGLTSHSFTDPEANDDEMGLHYNPLADRRSWESTVQFLEEIL